MNEIDGWQVEVQIKTILQKMGLTDIQKESGHTLWWSEETCGTCKSIDGRTGFTIAR